MMNSVDLSPRAVVEGYPTSKVVRATGSFVFGLFIFEVWSVFKSTLLDVVVALEKISYSIAENIAVSVSFFCSDTVYFLFFSNPY